MVLLLVFVYMSRAKGIGLKDNIILNQNMSLSQNRTNVFFFQYLTDISGVRILGKLFSNYSKICNIFAPRPKNILDFYQKFKTFFFSTSRCCIVFEENRNSLNIQNGGPKFAKLSCFWKMS